MSFIRATPAILLIAGCSFFSHSQSRFFSLEPLAPQAAVSTARGTPVAIDGVELPPGFDRREIVVRQPAQQLEVRSTDQWSASLQPLVLHVLAFDLAARLPQGMTILPGEARPAIARSVDIVFQELAAGPDAHVVADAQFTIRTGSVPATTHHERIEIAIASTGSADVAEGTNRALAALADRIAAAVATE